MIIKIKIKDLLNEHNMTQKELSRLSGVPEATLSDIVNDKRASVNVVHLANIAKVFRLKNIEQILDLVEIPVKKERG